MQLKHPSYFGFEMNESSLLLQVVEFLPGNCAPTKDVKALARAVKANRK
jgi:hypothetical protein